MRYGTATCKKDIELSVWDGSNDVVPIKGGEELIISYHECDGSLGLAKGDVEFCCSYQDRKCFKEKWDT